MRITALLLIITAFCLQANNSYSQNVKVSLNIQNATITDIFREIENQTDYRFFYNKTVLDTEKRVSVDTYQKAVSAILDQLLAGENVCYTMVNNYIVLTPKEGGKTNSSAVAQNNRKTITGRVTDEHGEPIIGANVIEKGTINGTVTDIDGNYTLSVPSGATIIFSYIGYNSLEIAWDGQPSLNVVLKEDQKMLDEVVVVGYGVQKRLNVAGSVSSIRADELVKSPVASVSNALAGKLPGLITLQSSGLPGSDQATLKIRGFDSPLVLVDGAEGDFNALDANEIESISILKDASAAIYGARAGNGVILITTKRGIDGKPKLTLNTSLTWQGITRMPKLASSGQLAEMRREGHIQGGQPEETAPYTLEEIQKFYDGGDPQYPNTDWYNLLIRPWSPQQQHNLSIRGGSDKIKYYGFIGYMQQSTFFKRSGGGYNRFNIRGNIDAKITNSLTAKMDLSTIISSREYTTRNLDANIWGDFWGTSPMYPDRFPDPTKIPYAEGGGTGGAHITTDRNLSGYSDRRSQDIRFVGELHYDFRNIKGLQAKTLVDYKQSYAKNKNFSKPVPFYQYDYAADVYTYAGAFGTTANLEYALPSNRQILYQTSLSYQNTFKAVHELNVLALFEAIDYYSDEVMAARSNFITPAIDEMLAGSTEGMTNRASTTEMGRMSWVGRLNYTYNNRYILDATFRADASAKFPPKSRWGFFPSASLAWRIDQEDFMQSFENLDALKLRLSYGASGNDDVSNFAYITGYDITGSNTGGSYIFGGKRYSGIVSKGLPNPNLTWEKLKIYNVGSDFSWWNGKFYGSLDVFYRKRTGIPADRLITLPSSFGAQLPKENLNSTNTRGFELMLATSGRKADFSWDLSTNISWARSKWDYYEEPDYEDPDQRRINRNSGQWTDRIFGYLTDGLFTSQEEIDNLGYDQDQRGNITLRPGDVKYLDVNKDGTIDWKDQVVIGNGSLSTEAGKSSVPTWMVGINPSFRYKDFDFDILFQGALGFDVIAALDSRTYEYYKNRWTEANNNRNALVPRLGGAASNGWTSDYRLVSGNYLRLKSLNIGYTLKNNILLSADVESLRIYFSGVNLFTWSYLNKYGLDPEVPSGRGGSYYPQQRNLSLGLVLTF
ncbi:SusC/RagA family TonB-linked outer membrane protein [Proteiniphilum sp. X52]|nr:SusC/RagA family TonB-linked outer membrane protein [Proteiniphilum sp. X52]